MYPDQTPPPSQPNGFYSVGGGDQTPRVSRRSLGKIIGISSVAVICLAIIGGTLFGLNHIFGIAAEEQAKLASARQANEALPVTERVYFGDGTDIEQIVDAKKVTACPGDFKDKGDICEKVETVTASPAQYNCPGDYKKKGSGQATSCEKTVGGKTDTKAASQDLSCERGYDLAAGQCQQKVRVDYIVSYYCDAGFVTSGVGAATKCTKTRTEMGVVSSTCPSGYTKSGSGVTATCSRSEAAASKRGPSTCAVAGSNINSSGTLCIKTVAAIASTSYSCPSLVKAAGRSNTIVGSLCRYTWNGTLGCGVKSGTSYVQVSGAYKSGSYCFVNAIATTSYSCLSGGVKSVAPGGTYCTFSNPIVLGAWIYSCSGGVTPTGTNCIYYASPILSCASGFAKSGSGTGTQCSAVRIDNASAKVKKDCPANHAPSGDKCEQVLKVAAKVTYRCSGEYELSGSTCSFTTGGSKVTANPIVSYKCPATYKTTGSGSSMTCSKEKKTTAKKTISYQCDESWTRRDTGGKIDCVLVKPA